jgi:hypothetical protein
MPFDGRLTSDYFVHIDDFQYISLRIECMNNVLEEGMVWGALQMYCMIRMSKRPSPISMEPVVANIGFSEAQLQDNKTSSRFYSVYPSDNAMGDARKLAKSGLIVDRSDPDRMSKKIRSSASAIGSDDGSVGHITEGRANQIKAYSAMVEAQSGDPAYQVPSASLPYEEVRTEYPDGSVKFSKKFLTPPSSPFPQRSPMMSASSSSPRAQRTLASPKAQSAPIFLSHHDSKNSPPTPGPSNLNPRPRAKEPVSYIDIPQDSFLMSYQNLDRDSDEESLGKLSQILEEREETETFEEPKNVKGKGKAKNVTFESVLGSI